MTDDNWKTIRVPKDAWKEAKAQKDEHDRTWGEQLVCDNTTTTKVVESDAVVESLMQEIDALAFDGAISDQEAERIISSLNAIEERTNSIEGTLEDMGGR